MASLPVDEFSAWFKCQEAATRLDILTAILQMLHPLELRFVSSCVEELTKKDYYCFREFEVRYNGENVGAEFNDLTDSCSRSKLLVALSLLNSGNYAAAGALYKALQSLGTVYHKLPRTKDVLDEVLLLLNMAKHHPAFKFDQRLAVADLADNILRFSKKRSSCGNLTFSGGSSSPSTDDASPQLLVMSNGIRTDVSSGQLSSTVSGSQCTSIREENSKVLVNSGSQTDEELSDQKLKSMSPALSVEQSQVEIKAENPESSSQSMPISSVTTGHTTVAEDVSIIGMEETGNRNCIYKLKVLWSNGAEAIIEKSFEDWRYFHMQLLNLHPIDAGLFDATRTLPYFPGFCGCTSGETEKHSLNTYLTQLKLSSKIMQSVNMAEFLITSTILPEFPVNGYSTDALYADDLGLQSTSDIYLDFQEQNYPTGSELQQLSQIISDGQCLDVQEMWKRDNSSFEQSSAPASITADHNAEKKSIMLYSRDVDKPLLPLSSMLGNYDGLHQSLATALLIVRPSSASPSLEKMLQSNLLSRDNAPKFLTTGGSKVKLEPSPASAVNTYLANDGVQ